MVVVLPPGLMIALLGTGFILLGNGIERIVRVRSKGVRLDVQ